MTAAASLEATTQTESWDDAATAGATSLNIHVPFRYTRIVTPPRCRKPREEVTDGDTVVSIRRVTAAEAPVALRVTAKPELPEDGEEQYAFSRFDGTGEYRVFGGRLWRASAMDADVALDPTHLARRAIGNSWHPDQIGTILTRLREAGDRLLLVDEVLYEAAGEPAWHVVREWGFRRGEEIRILLEMTGGDHVSPEWFRADDLATAEAFADACATALADADDPDNRPTIRRSGFAVEVLVPEALQRSFAPSPDNRASHTITIEAVFETAGPMPLSDLGGQVGYRLPDGRFLLPTLAFALVDNAANTRVLVSEADAATVGLRRDPERRSTLRMRDEDR